MLDVCASRAERPWGMVQVRSGIYAIPIAEVFFRGGTRNTALLRRGGRGGSITPLSVALVVLAQAKQ